MKDTYMFCLETIFLEVSTLGYQINLPKINLKCQRQFQYKDLPGMAAPSSINLTFLAGPVMVGGHVWNKEGWKGLGVHRPRSYMFGPNAYIRYFPPLSTCKHKAKSPAPMDVPSPGPAATAGPSTLGPSRGRCQSKFNISFPPFCWKSKQNLMECW